QIEDDPRKQGVRERDGDTTLLKDGRRIRHAGGDTPEIPHTKNGRLVGRFEPFSREATELAKQLAPDGSWVRVTATSPRDTVKPDPNDYGRIAGYIDAIPAAVAHIRGLRDIWPGTDITLEQMKAGVSQPAYEFLSEDLSRWKPYHDAATDAFKKGLGVFSPQGKRSSIKFHWKPGDTDLRGDPPGNELMNWMGIGLMAGAHTGTYKNLGPVGNTLAVAHNALLALGGTIQQMLTPPKTKPKVYKAPDRTYSKARTASRKKAAAAKKP
ncbi:MAG: hypothetical protein NTY02_20325, partial [Acidobacteria bacterium]|nr:hypothetical protein [Acidobacteriota bacterium]